MSKVISRRDFLKLAGLGTASTVMASCAAKPSETTKPTEGVAEQPTAVPPAKKVKVRFTMFGHPNMIEVMAPLFNESHPDVEVDFERSEGQNYSEKIMASIAAGSAWDCWRFDNVGAVLKWGRQGVVIDAKPFLEADKTYPMDDYLPGVLDSAAKEGKVFGVPTWAITMWMFFNKKMYDEAGLKYPTADTSWDEYVDMATKLTKRDASGNITQYGSNGWSGWTFPMIQLAWSNGGQFYYNDDFTKVTIDDPKTIEAFQGVADLILVHKTNPSPLNPPTSPVGLLSDNVATEGNGDYIAWDNKDAFTAKYDYLDAVQCPKWHGNRKNIYWAQVMVINSKSDSDVQAGSYKWLSWFAADPASLAIQGKVIFPVVKRAYEDPEVAKTWLVNPRPPTQIATALDHSKEAKFWKVEEHGPDIDTIYYNEISNLWNGKASAEEVLKSIAKQANEVLAQPIE